MSDVGLGVVVVAAIVFAAGCTVLPGLVVATAGLFRRRGQRSRPAVLGPLFWYELTRLARRGQQPRLRAVYACVLLVGLLVTYLNEFREVNPIQLIAGTGELVPLDRMASFSSRFLTTFLFCQLIGVVLVTPVYAGGAVPDERDRGTLEFLQASLLTNREIVAALLTARLVFVAGLVLAGLPILGLTMLFGGVAGGVLVGGFVVALMTVLSLGTFCLFLGVRGRGLREVLFWAYGTVGAVAIIGTCCSCVPGVGTVSPFTVTFLLLNTSSGGPLWAWNSDILVAFFVATHGILAAVFAWRATVGIRVPPPAWSSAVAKLRRRKQVARDDADDPRPKPRYRRVEEADERRYRERPTPRSFRVPRIGTSDPLIWKERFFSGRMPGFERGLLSGCLLALAILILFPVGLWLFVALFEYVAKGEDPGTILNPLAKCVGFAAAVGLASAVGIRAAVSVSRERQRNTLDALFSLPVTRRAILWAKWLTTVLWVRYWVLSLAVVVVIAGALGSVHLFGLLVASLLLVSFVPFAATLGLWLSVRCRSATASVTWFVVVMLALFLAPLLIATLTRSAFQLGGNPVVGVVAEQLVESFSVPFAVWEALFRWGEFRKDETNRSLVLGAGLLTAGGYSLVAWLLWRDSVRRFDREGK